MRTFKDTLEKDLDTFINPKEFADKHTLNGREVVCIVDKDITEALKQTVSNPFTGVFVNALTIHIKTADIEQRPVEGEQIFLDDEMYIVRNVSDEAGGLVIVVEGNRQ